MKIALPAFSLLAACALLFAACNQQGDVASDEPKDSEKPSQSTTPDQDTPTTDDKGTPPEKTTDPQPVERENDADTKQQMKQPDSPTATPEPAKSPEPPKTEPAPEPTEVAVSEKQPRINENAEEEMVELIPRKVLFGNPDKATARISSDGKLLAYRAPVEGVMNLWVGPPTKPDEAKPITHDKKRGIRQFFWAYDNKHILYLQDEEGDENWHVYAVNVETKEVKDLTPIEEIHAQIEGVSELFPEEVLIGLNDRKPQFHDIYRVNILTGERELIQENPGFAGFLADDDYDIRMAITFTPTGGQTMLVPDEGAEQGWKEFLSIDPLDAMSTHAAGFDKTGEKLYFVDSRDRNTSALTVYDLASGDQELLAEDDRADVGSVLMHPTEKNIQAVSFTYAREEWKILDDAIRDDLEYLQTVEDGELQVTSRTLDDKLWTVAYIMDNGPVKFYLYDAEAKKADYLFSSHSEMEKYRLATMHPVIIEARDGLKLVSYLTLPVSSDTDGDGIPSKPLPMVLDVHGGPWSRDSWGLNPTHQWLSNRGYAVLSVNFRGSTGLGKEFTNAADGEWAGKMHDDLIDAVNWAVEKKVADRDNVAIMGGSYGGYATLVGLTFTPEVFACGVDIVGPSSLVTLLENVPPYWIPFMPVMKRRVGDHTTEEGRAELLEKSPLTKVDDIKRPLLIGQGAHDPRVTQLEADQIVSAMEERKIPVTYVLFPDEGHGFVRPENRMAFNAVVEAFLAEQLGGRYQPIGDAFEGSTIEVPAGANDVPGLDAALEVEE